MSRPVSAARCVLVFAWLVAVGVCPGEEILRNGGFEETDRGSPAVWRCNGAVTVAGPGRSGQSAVKLGAGGRVLQCFALEPDVIFEGCVWVRGSGQIGISFYEYRDGPGRGYTSGVSSTPVDLTDQWQPIHLAYSQGPNELGFKGLCFAVGAGRAEAEVFIDDASVQKKPFVGVRPNLLANPTLRDADGDGLPDGWHAEKRRIGPHAAPGGVPALRCAATLFSADYLPDAQFRQWWSWRRWGEPSSSGWPALPRPLAGAHSTLLESEPVPVLPGRRYDVEFLLRLQEVWGEFATVRWFTADKKPARGGAERIGYSWHQGISSDWVRYTGRVTSPQFARYATVAIGARLGSGALWVARPALREGRGAPSRHEPRLEHGPTDLSEGVPRVEPPARPAAQVAPPGNPGVWVGDGGIRIVFPSGVALELPLRQQRLIGVTQVQCGGTLLRSPRAPPLAPLVETAPLREHTQCMYQGWRQVGDDVEIQSVLRTAEGKEDHLDWVFGPSAQTLAGRRYLGLHYGYRVRSQGARVLRIADRATWELAGSPLGLEVGQRLYRLGAGSEYCLACAYRFVAAEAFEYQTGPAGTLLGIPERPSTVLSLRSATPEFVILQDVHLFPEETCAATAFKNILFCPESGGADNWAAVRDELYARHRQQLTVPPEPAMVPTAMLLGYRGAKGIGALRCKPDKPDRSVYYRWVADKALPCLAELGFRRVMIVLGMDPWDRPGRNINVLAPQSAESFKYLCDRAHARGLGMIAWYGTLQNMDQSPVWAKHPEFILMGPKGQRSRTYYSPDGWPGRIDAGFGRFTLDLLRKTREQTGLDALWLDSYSNATHLMDTARFADAVRQADGLLPWHTALEQMGYITYCEGGPSFLGTPASGWEPPDDWSRFRPETFYKTAPYLQQPYRGDVTARFLVDPGRRHYYRMLANLCCPILDPGQFDEDQAALGLVRQANRDFNAVADCMQNRRLLGRAGVEWSSPAGKAVFAFEPCAYAVTPGLSLRDVTEGTDVSLPGDRRVRLRRYHTYRLTGK